MPGYIIVTGLFLCHHLGMWKKYNPNPEGKKTEDCTIRALCKALSVDWETAFVKLSFYGLKHHDMMQKNYVWGDLLINEGFSRSGIPNSCPECYTIADFAKDHPAGLYVVGTGEHVVTVVDGDWYDTWDSGNEIPIIYYWRSYAV